MNPRIAELIVEETRVNTAEAVLMVTANLDAPSSGAELRGRLIGPNRPGHSTIAVAFPLLPCPSEEKTITARIVIPEPNLWTPEAPFDYSGVAEVWQAGVKMDSRTFKVALKAR